MVQAPRRARFDPRPVHVRFVVKKVALGQAFLRVLSFSLVTVMPPWLHSHLHCNTVVISVAPSNAAVPLQSPQEGWAAFVRLKSELTTVAVSPVQSAVTKYELKESERHDAPKIKKKN